MEDDSIYLFDSDRKDGNGSISSSGTAVILKFDTLHSLENYIRYVYYSLYPLTLYFQIEFINIHGPVNVRKKGWLSDKNIWQLKREDVTMIQEWKVSQLRRDMRIKKWIHETVQKRKICVKSNIKHYISESKVSGKSWGAAGIQKM